MKTNEFLQTVNAAIYVSGKINNLKEIILQIDELRKLHVRLQAKLDYMLLDPFSYESPAEREKVKSTAHEIKDLANEYKILVSFFKLPNEHSQFREQFKDKVFATYWYNSTQITDLIVYRDWKTKKKSINKTIEQIKEIVFDLNEPNFQVFDKDGNDINKIPGVDL